MTVRSEQGDRHAPAWRLGDRLHARLSQIPAGGSLAVLGMRGCGVWDVGAGPADSPRPESEGIRVPALSRWRGTYTPSKDAGFSPAMRRSSSGVNPSAASALR